MKFDLKLLPLFVGDSALDVTHVADSDLAPRHSHPCFPSVVTRSAQWMVRVTVRCPNRHTTTCQGFHRSEADVRLFASVLSQVFRDQPNQRTCRTAVRLLRRQLNLNNISLRHSYFSFLQYRLFLLPFFPSWGLRNPSAHSHQWVAKHSPL